MTPLHTSRNAGRQAKIRHHLKTRSIIINSVRNYFTENNFLEVETPCRIKAPLPEAHIDAQPCGQWFLHTSPESCMKQLLCAGYERIFQICKCFRQAERSKKHLSEFTMLEWYQTKADYHDLMAHCEQLIRHIAFKLNQPGRIDYQGQHIDLSAPFAKMTVEQAFAKYTDLSVSEALLRDLFDEYIALKIEPHLGVDKPTFLYDYPASQAALSKLCPENPGVAQRFELYIAGLELCNGFTELNDPDEQTQRFMSENRIRQAAGKTIYPFPHSFIKALKDMPDAAGNALGLDRLVMLFVHANTIDDVVAFVPEEL